MPAGVVCEHDDGGMRLLQPGTAAIWCARGCGFLFPLFAGHDDPADNVRAQNLFQSLDDDRSRALDLAPPDHGPRADAERATREARKRRGFGENRAGSDVPRERDLRVGERLCIEGGAQDASGSDIDSFHGRATS